MKNITRIGIFLVPLFACLTLAQETSTAPSTQPPKELLTLKRGTINATIDADGYFEPLNAAEVRIRPKAYQGDLLVARAAPHGASVKKGDVILEIDSTQLQKQLASAENDLATAQANLTKAEADVKLGDAGDALAAQMAEAELSNAEAGLKWWEQVDGQHMIKNAELGVKTAQNNVEDQGDELDQLRKMYKSEELTSATADIVVKRAIRALELAKIREGMAEGSAEKTKAFDYMYTRQKLVFNIEKEKQELAQLRVAQEQQKALRQTALAAARIAADRANLRLADLREDADAFSFKAPFDGVVLYGQLQRGTWQNSDPRLLRPDDKVNPGQTLLTLVSPEKLHLTIDVPEAKLGMVKAGLGVRVIPAGHPDAACLGTCGAPSPAGVMREWGQVFPTPVELSKLDPRILAGEKAQARVEAGSANDVLIVPVGAVTRGRVKIRTGEEEAWRDVVIGRSDGESVEIIDGLKEGDQILAKPGR